MQMYGATRDAFLRAAQILARHFWKHSNFTARIRSWIFFCSPAKKAQKNYQAVTNTP